MKRFTARHFVRLIVLGACVALVTRPGLAAKSAVKMTTLTGSVELSAEGPTPFSLAGIASHLGKFTAVGEIEFFPGDDEGSLAGEGVVVFKAANGDLLVGNVTWNVGPADGDDRGSHLHFGWADSVKFDNGEVVASTGRFTDNRPPGLVVVADGTTKTSTEPNIIVLILITILRR